MPQWDLAALLIATDRKEPHEDHNLKQHDTGSLPYSKYDLFTCLLCTCIMRRASLMHSSIILAIL